MSRKFNDLIEDAEYIVRDAAFSTKKLGDAFLGMRDSIGELTHALDDLAFSLHNERCKVDQQAVKEIIKDA